MITPGVDKATVTVSDCGVLVSSARDGKEGNWKSIARLAVADAAFASQLKFNFLPIIYRRKRLLI